MNCSRTGRGSASPAIGCFLTSANRWVRARCLLVMVGMVGTSPLHRSAWEGSVIRWFLVRHSIGGTSPGGRLVFRSLVLAAVRVSPGVGGGGRLPQGFLDQPRDFDTVLHARIEHETDQRRVARLQAIREF